MSVANKTLKQHLNEARKEYFSKLKPVAKWSKKPVRQDHEVRVYYKIPKYLPFEVTNKRVRGWEHIRTLPDGGTLRTRAHETVTPGDIFVLIAAIKVFQDNWNDVVPSLFESQEMITVTIGYSEFAKKYIKHHDRKMLIRILENLYSYHAFWQKPDGSIATQRYLYNFSLDQGQKNLTLTISKAFAGLCEDYGWLVNFDLLQKISSPTARALFLYLGCNSGNEFKQETIEHWLDMKRNVKNPAKSASDNKRQIKKALDELSIDENTPVNMLRSHTVSKTGNFQIVLFEEESSVATVSVSNSSVPTVESVRSDRIGFSETPVDSVGK